MTIAVQCWNKTETIGRGDGLPRRRVICTFKRQFINQSAPTLADIEVYTESVEDFVVGEFYELEIRAIAK